MKVNRLAVVIFAVSMLLIAENVLADEIWLKNGDRITGIVKKMEDMVLIFKTPYAGEMSIKWAEITAVTTDSPIEMVLDDDTSFLGSMEPAPEGQIELQLVDETVERLAVDLSEVKAINPTPPERGLEIKARLNIGVKVETGNTDKEEYDVDGRVSLRSEKNRFIFFGEYTRQLKNRKALVNMTDSSPRNFTSMALLFLKPTRTRISICASSPAWGQDISFMKRS
jgi:hypothetical protein